MARKFHLFFGIESVYVFPEKIIKLLQLVAAALPFKLLEYLFFSILPLNLDDECFREIYNSVEGSLELVFL